MEASSRMTSYSSKRETLFPRSRERLLAIFQLQNSAIFPFKMDLEAFKNSEFENVMSWVSPSMKEVSHTRQWWSKPSTHLSQLLQCLLYLRTYHTIPNISAPLPWRAYNKGKPKYSPKVWWNTFDRLHQKVMNIMGKEFAIQKQGFWLGSISLTESRVCHPPSWTLLTNYNHLQALAYLFEGNTRLEVLLPNWQELFYKPIWSPWSPIYLSITKCAEKNVLLRHRLLKPRLIDTIIITNQPPTAQGTKPSNRT